MPPKLTKDAGFSPWGNAQFTPWVHYEMACREKCRAGAPVGALTPEGVVSALSDEQQLPNAGAW